MEWIVFDDGQEPVGDLFDTTSLSVRYIYSEEKLTIGEKRNRLNELATGEILIAIDDDDYYFPERVAEVVAKFKMNPTVNLAGSSELYMYFTDTKEIYTIGPYFTTHATNGTLACRKSYTLTHRYDETVVFAEERSFLDDYKNPLIQLNPMKVMLVMSHGENTFDKASLRKDNNLYSKKTSLKLKDFIKDKVLLEFYSNI